MTARSVNVVSRDQAQTPILYRHDGIKMAPLPSSSAAC